MKVFAKKVRVLAGFVTLTLLLTGWASAPKKPPELGLCPLKESQAYRQFLNRPVCEYSKIMFLIERFKNMPYEIVYDGRYYKIRDVAGIAGAFLRFNYKKDRPAKQWILQYANRSLGSNDAILLRLSNGSSYRAGEILIQELENLERTLLQPSLPRQVTLPEHLQVRIGGNNTISPDTLPLAASQ